MAPNATQLEFYFRSEEAWQAMYADCQDAQKSICMEQYILMDDDAGRRFLQLFATKAKQGVIIRLIFDGVGCRGLLNNPVIKDIRAAGGEVHFFHALWWRHIFFPSRWLPRTHVKTLLIDDAVAYTGSACISSRMRNWHDLNVRMAGPVVMQVKESLERAWTVIKHGKKALKTPPAFLSGDFRYVASEPRLGPGQFYIELLAQLKSARKRIRIVTPYFLPPRRLRKALKAAAARGVSVEILISAVSDVPLADHVSHTYFSRLLRRGLNLLLFHGGILHAKYVLIDDDWATVGSVNIDYLSLTKNREASLVIRDPAIVGELWSRSQSYVSKCETVNEEYVRSIPALSRLIGYLGLYMKEML